jgi:hypothetical protein
MSKIDTITNAVLAMAVIGLLMAFAPSASCESNAGGAVSIFAPSLLCSNTR